MNFSERQNEFCGIPGFDASKGERINKALWKLWEKIQYLEKSRTSEKKSRSEASCSFKDEDLTLTDVQYKLLLLQLQYVRSLLKKKSHRNAEVFQSKINEVDQKLPAPDRNVTSECNLHPNTVDKPASVDIYTADNSVTQLSSAKELHCIENKFKNIQITPDNQFLKFKNSFDKSATVYQKPVPHSSKPHYHLKLDDVPFILGASSTASHSVVANLQNIIARMRFHNKALCGPKTAAKSALANAYSSDFTDKNCPEENLKADVARFMSANAQSTDLIERNSAEENTQLLNELTKELSALAVKQQKLVESIDASQIKKHGPEMSSARNIQSKGSKITYKHVENDDSQTHRSHSESEVKLHAEIKKMPKKKERDFVKLNNRPKQSASNIRSQSSNLSIMDRRKLLRSLQSFKKHLSEEDISWN